MSDDRLPWDVTVQPGEKPKVRRLPTHQRDTQRNRAYRAEDVLRDHAANKRMEAMADIEAYLVRVRGSAWFRRRYPAWALNRGIVEVHDGRARRTAMGTGSLWPNGKGFGYIVMPRWSRSTYIVLHELAHVIVNRVRPGQPRLAAHGREWARAYLELVGAWMGRDAGRMLRASFVQHGVRYRPRRILTPDQRATLAARLAPYRTARAAAAKDDGA